MKQRRGDTGVFSTLLSYRRIELLGRDHCGEVVVLSIKLCDAVWDVGVFSGIAGAEYEVHIGGYLGRARHVVYFPAFFTLYIEMLADFLRSREGVFLAGGVGEEDWIFRIYPCPCADTFVVHVRLRSHGGTTTPEEAIQHWPDRGTPTTLETMFMTDEASLANMIAQAKALQSTLQEAKARRIDAYES